MSVGPATGRDLEAVTRLLVETGLPTADLNDQFPSAYVLARERDTIVGVAGLEVYGASGLLRSVAVTPSLRQRGVGRALVDDCLTTARVPGLDAVYLLTTTAAEYFGRMGFARRRPAQR